MSRLSSALDDVRSGRSRVVQLVGDPGSGKTSLLTRLANHARQHGVPVLTQRCYGREQNMPLQTIANLLYTALITDALDVLPVPLADRVRAALVDRTVGGGPDAALELRRAVRVLLRSWAGEGLVLLIDDVHWTDPESIELIEYLVRKPVDAPLLLVLAHRGRQAPARLAAALADGWVEGAVERIDLGPLALADAALLLDLPVTAPELARLHAEAESNPLYLRALAAGEIPEQVAAVLNAEMALLGRPEAAVADAAAIFGEFTLNGIAYVTGLSADVVCHAVGDLHRRNLIRTVARSPTYMFTFRHKVVADVRYAAIDPCQRRRAHLRTFLYLVDRGADCALVDRHVELALAMPEPETVRAVLEAAERVVCTRPDAAARWLGAAARALAAAGAELPELVEVADLLARSLAAAGEYARSREVLDDIASNPAHGEEPGRLRVMSAAALRDAVLGLPVEAPMTAPSDAVELMIARGLARLVETGAPDIDAVRLAMATARRHQDVLGETGALALQTLGQVYAGDVGEAVRGVVACARLADGMGDDQLDRYPEYLAILGWAELLMCWLQPAQRHFRRGLELARRTGRVHVLPLLLIGLSEVRRQTGRTDEAKSLAAEAAEYARRMDAGEVLGLALTAEALSAVSQVPQGDREALWLAERAVAEASPGHGWSRDAMVALAFAAHADGDAERCRTLVLEAGGGPDLTGLPPFLRPACFEALTSIAIGRGEDAQPWAERAEAAAEVFPLPAQRGSGALARAHLLYSAGDSGGAVSLYLWAADTFAPAGLVAYQMRALLLGAMAAAESGALHLANVFLGQGQALALRQGVTRPAPDRPGEAEEARPPDTALRTLTNREHEVALIAGEGATTREIAKRLSLSPRTVDVHLTRIYRKLHLRSRAELARFIAAVN